MRLQPSFRYCFGVLEVEKINFMARISRAALVVTIDLLLFVVPLPLVCPIRPQARSNQQYLLRIAIIVLFILCGQG